MPKVPKIRSLHIFAISPEKREREEGEVFCLQINTNIFYKLIVSLWVCVARHAQSTQNNKCTISFCNISRKTWRMNLIFCLQVNVKVSSNCYYHFRFVLPDIPKVPKITSLLFLCNILRKNWVMKLIFCMQISMKACYKLILWFWRDGQVFPKFPK